MSPSKRTKKTARKSATRKPAKKTEPHDRGSRAAQGRFEEDCEEGCAQEDGCEAAKPRRPRARPLRARKPVRAGPPRRKRPQRRARKPAGTTVSSAVRAPVVKRKSAPPAPPRPRARRKGPVSPDVARQHFQELLEAKIERVRQGPSYPPANEFTGQRPSESGAAGDARSPGDANKPAPEATYGDPTFTHGRGNQGMRPQK